MERTHIRPARRTSPWLNELQQTVVSVGLMDAKVENTEAEVLHLRDLQRAMFVKNDVPANTVLTRDDLFFAIPYAKGDYVANDFSKYVAFTTTEPIAANKSVNEGNCQVSDSRSEVLDIVPEGREIHLGLQGSFFPRAPSSRCRTTTVWRSSTRRACRW